MEVDFANTIFPSVASGVGGRKTTNRISPSGKAHGSVGEASEQDGGRVSTCFLCLILCLLVVHPADPRIQQASERTLTWGSAQTRAPCPPLPHVCRHSVGFYPSPQGTPFPAKAKLHLRFGTWGWGEGGFRFPMLKQPPWPHAAVRVEEPRQRSPSKP